MGASSKHMTEIIVKNADFTEVHFTPADLIISDHPYRTTDLKFDRKKFDVLEYVRTLHSNMRSDGWLFVFSPVRDLPYFTRYFHLQFQYVWEKPGPVLHSGDAVMPYAKHEMIYAFCNLPQFLKSKKLLTFHKQQLRTPGKPYRKKFRRRGTANTEYAQSARISGMKDGITVNTGYREGTSILKFPSKSYMTDAEKTAHPTQKSLGLIEYLIRGYSNPGDTVMDLCAGSGTTVEACQNTGRNLYATEKDPEYFKIIKRRCGLSPAPTSPFNYRIVKEFRTYHNAEGAV